MIDRNLLNALEEDEDAVERLWSVIKTIILERTTRQALIERPKISIAKIQEWACLPEAPYRLQDMPAYSRERI